MINEKYLNERNLFVFAACISIIYYVFLIPISHMEFQQYDAYYYQSVAEALNHQGRLLDYTTIPPREILTPQNGIVFIYALLEQFGISEKVTQLRIVAFINSFLIVISTIFLFRIIRLFGLSNTVAFLLALTFPLSFFYQFTLLLQKNDCIFITLSLITIYKLLQQKNPTDSLPSLVILAIAMSLFRIVGILIFISSLITFLIQKQYKKSLVSLGLVFVSFGTLYLTLVLFDIDTSRMALHSRESTSLYSLDFIYQQIEKTLTLSIPESILRFTYYTTNIALSSKLVGITISALFIILLLINLKQAISGQITNKTSVIFLVIYILATLAFFQLYKAQPTRYLLPISPLLPMLLFFHNKMRESYIVAILVVIMTTFVSFVGFYKTDKFLLANERYEYWKSYASIKELEGMQLVAYLPRVSYFLLNKRSLREIPEKISIPDDGLIIVGPDSYIQMMLNKIDKSKFEKYILYSLPVAYHGYIRNEIGPHYFPFQKMIIKTVVVKPNVSNEK